jgi:hypothetical protein
MMIDEHYCSILPLNLPKQARYMIRFLESAIDFVGAAATATGRAADDLRCNRLVNLWLNL